MAMFSLPLISSLSNALSAFISQPKHGKSKDKRMSVIDVNRRKQRWGRGGLWGGVGGSLIIAMVLDSILQQRLSLWFVYCRFLVLNLFGGC